MEVKVAFVALRRSAYQMGHGSPGYGFVMIDRQD